MMDFEMGDIVVVETNIPGVGMARLFGMAVEQCPQTGQVTALLFIPRAWRGNTGLDAAMSEEFVIVSPSDVVNRCGKIELIPASSLAKGKRSRKGRSPKE